MKNLAEMGRRAKKAAENLALASSGEKDRGLAAIAAGADGLIIEVHNDPAHALCDGPQSLKPEDFDPLAKKLLALHGAVKSLEG